MVGEVVDIAPRYAAALDAMQVGPGDREVWTEAPVTLPRIRDWLRPDGCVCLVIDAPSDPRLAAMADEATAALRFHGFRDPARGLQPADRLAVMTAHPVG